ncbi:hypothetical protein GPALN_011444 [Globodera pallida]|nr:hypothetical protein GPALN_011444 [Globodera pallida]
MLLVHGSVVEWAFVPRFIAHPVLFLLVSNCRLGAAAAAEGCANAQISYSSTPTSSSSSTSSSPYSYSSIPTSSSPYSYSSIPTSSSPSTPTFSFPYSYSSTPFPSSSFSSSSTSSSHSFLQPPAPQKWGSSPEGFGWLTNPNSHKFGPPCAKFGIPTKRVPSVWALQIPTFPPTFIGGALLEMTARRAILPPPPPAGATNPVFAPRGLSINAKLHSAAAATAPIIG